MLASLRDLHDTALWPLIDAGMAGSIVYWVRSPQVGDSLASYKGAVHIRDIGAIVQSIANALSQAHSVGLSHGAITGSSILRYPSGSWALYGLGIMGRGPASDQFDLARAVVERLAGRSWVEPDVSAFPDEERPYHRAQRLRDALGMITERVVNVLNKAMHLDPSQRYPDIALFGADLVEQIRISGDDLVHGAFEAISARNVELARLITEKASSYNPDSENLTLLRLQLNGGSVFGTPQAHPGQPHPVPPPFVPVMPPPSDQSMMASAPSESADLMRQLGAPAIQPTFEQLTQAMTLPPMQSQTGMSASNIPAELTHGLPPEFVQMIAPQFQAKPVKKGINPIFVLALGGIGVVLLLLIAAIVTFFVSGS
jgi:hypothetical protein